MNLNMFESTFQISIYQKLACFYVLRLGHLKFNSHFLKSIFDLLTLNRFLNGFLHYTRGRPKKIHEFFPAPYRPPNQLFHFLVSPFLVPFRTNSTQAPDTLASNVFFYEARYF